MTKPQQTEPDPILELQAKIVAAWDSGDTASFNALMSELRKQVLAYNDMKRKRSPSRGPEPQ